jgi:NAD(P)-dependent dehydrogenase (short-subunit alcohol dehydrogenase family)
MPTLEERSNLRGKHAIVIGGGFGIGASITAALADGGVNLAICDIDREALPTAEARAQQAGVSVLSRCVDAFDVDALKRFYDEAGERMGHADIVVNVAGGTMFALFENTTPEDWGREIHRNFGYVLHSTKAALPLLRKSGRGGSIINFTTIEAFRGAASVAVYAGAKAGLTNFSRAMAVELGRDRIRVNTLAPDLTPTRGMFNCFPAEERERLQKLPKALFEKGIAIATPRGDPPTHDEIANAVLFLASDLSTGITGTTLHVDGGTFAAFGFNHWPFGDGFGPIPFEQTLRHLFPEELSKGT